ncbi:MAG: CBS domain-containing protein [Burkholderiales bacterium]|nr:CBS domain-containing protein [Burkholderiales bacterium]
MKAADVMTTRVITVLPDTRVHEVARVLFANRVSAVPVVDRENRVLGMLSEGDIARRARSGPDGGGAWWSRAGGAGPAEPTAADIMTRELVRIGEDTPLEEAAALIERHGVKRLPVERGGRLVGIVSRANVAHGLAAARAGGAEAPGDAAIRATVLEALERAAVSTHLANVVVTGATVYLWGAVETISEHKAFVATAAATPGVKAVSDHLFVLASRLRPGRVED